MINTPTSSIAKLRLLVFQIARSPQRIQKYDNSPGCTKGINYDVDTLWDSSFVMIKGAEECHQQLEDTTNDEPDIESLRLTPDDWRQLSDIKEILVPFNVYTEYISEDSPSIHMAARMFGELRSILFAIKEQQGEWQQVSAAGLGSNNCACFRWNLTPETVP